MDRADGLRRRLVLLPSNRQHELLQTVGINRLGIPQALERLGFEVDFLDVQRAPLNPLANRASLFSSIDPLRALTVLFFRRRSMAVVAYYQSGALLVLALRRWLGFKPVVAIVDVGDDVGWPIRARMVGYCIARADAVFTFSSGQAAYLTQKYRTHNIAFLRQQVDTDFFTPGRGEGGYTLMVGSDASRDIGTLRKALFEDGTRIVLRTSLPVPDCPDHVCVIRERLDDHGLRDLYRGAELVVLPLQDTIYPGGITSLLEAFACGKASVVSNSQGVRDYLVDGENCLVVPCGDAGALKDAVRRLAYDDALRHRLEQGARRYAEKELSQDRHAARLADALTNLAVKRATESRSHRWLGALV